jgi:hypothetical protein
VSGSRPADPALAERLHHVGVEAWKQAATAKARTHDARWEAYVAWSRTPRGRATLALRRLRRIPWHLRERLACFVYPGDLRGELDDR